MYIFIALLFCLLTAGMGAASFTFYNAAMQKAQAPHLAVSTTLLALSPANKETSITLAPHYATEPFVFATNTLTLHNTGESPLTWQLDTTRSMVIFAPQEIKLWTVPSHGMLGRNEHSLIQVVAGGIKRTELAAKQNIELGYIVFTSNGGDASIRTTLKSTALPETHLASSSDLLKIAPSYSIATLTYVLRRQNL